MKRSAKQRAYDSALYAGWVVLAIVSFGGWFLAGWRGAVWGLLSAILGSIIEHYTHDIERPEDGDA